MDADRFDAIARRLGARVTRRLTLGGIAGMGLAGAAIITEGKSRPGKKPRRRSRRRPQAQGNCANPGPSRTLNGCDFAGKDLSGKNLSGSQINDATFDNAELAGADLSDSSLRRTSFRGANLCRAKLSSTSLNKADFRGADGPHGRPTNLTLADLRASGCGGVKFDADTIFCGTTMCNGAVRNDDCPAGLDPEDICCADADCGPARVCQNGECVPDPGTCAAGQNLCLDGTAPCDNRPGCSCVSTTSGATFCGRGSRCSDCSRDEDCTAVTGPGSVCADWTGPFCSCHETHRRACLSPCDTCTSDRQCSEHQRCCDGECRDCCTTADCRGKETCEGGRCVCDGCRSRINNTCVAGTAWAECGDDGERCQVCIQGEVCAADRQTCATCETYPSPGARTWCDAAHHFAEFRCGADCSCAQPYFGFNGACFDRGIAGYCLRDDLICGSNADCIREGYGDRCVAAGNCAEAAHCYQAVCVTECGGRPPHVNTDGGDGSPLIVVPDE